MIAYVALEHTFPVEEQSFTAVVFAGHKEHAVQVPLSPDALGKPVHFAPGRRGIPVKACVQGIHFTSHVVSRSGKFWLLLPAEVEHAAGLQVGSPGSFLLSPE